jgi:hypothetical protein
MAAFAGLDDPAARCGIALLRGAGLRLGELRDLELDCLWDLPGHGTWLKVPLGKLNTERVVPIDDATWPRSTPGSPSAAGNAPCRAPATADPPTSCSPSAASASAPPESGEASPTQSLRPDSPRPAGRPCTSPRTSSGTPTPPG